MTDIATPTHQMRIMGREGDSQITWDSEKEDSVDGAERMFNDLIGRGYHAFRVTGRGKQGERITTFDPEAEKLIMIPPMAGG